MQALTLLLLLLLLDRRMVGQGGSRVNWDEGKGALSGQKNDNSPSTEAHGPEWHFYDSV
jgi:hypothetical protein